MWCFLKLYGAHPNLHSFPTRRSSDLRRSRRRVGRRPESRRAPGRKASRCRRRGRSAAAYIAMRSEEHTSELQSHVNLVCRLLLEKKKQLNQNATTNKQSPDKRRTPDK